MAENKEEKGRRIPLGSIVKFEGEDFLICIIGYDVTDEGSNVTYHYSGVKAPLGFESGDRIYMFNDDIIEKIYAIGRMDNEEATICGFGNGSAPQGLLPIGSLVKTKKSSELYLIIGLCQADSGRPDETFDYGAVLYKYGYTAPNQLGVFNRDDIEDVLHVGFICDGHYEAEEKIAEFMNKKSK